MKTEKKQKYFVNRKETVAIQCLACGKVENYSLAGLKNKKNSLKINCSCTETFAVDLEFRHDFRRKTHLNCRIRPFSTPKERARHCTIADQSSGGLLLHVTDEVPIKPNDTLIVSYADSSSSEEIERIISVRHYHPGHRIGGAFIDTLPVGKHPGSAQRHPDEPTGPSL